MYPNGYTERLSIAGNSRSAARFSLARDAVNLTFPLRLGRSIEGAPDTVSVPDKTATARLP